MRQTRRAAASWVGSATMFGLFAGQSLSVGAWAQAVLPGVFTVNGKPESGKPVTVLVFTTKSQGADPKAAFNALFNKYENAIVAKVFADGKVYSVDPVHTSLDSPNGTLQVFGVLTIEDFSMAGGDISGRLTTGGVHEARNDKWDVDITFKTKAP
jgi:hypothetical protein